MGQFPKSAEQSAHLEPAAQIGVPAMRLDVLITHTPAPSPLYEWDREHGCLRLVGIARGSPHLPATLATVRLEGTYELPVVIVASVSLAPGTRAQARILGALRRCDPVRDAEPDGLAVDGWVLIAAPEDDPAMAHLSSLEMLPETLLQALQTFVNAPTFGDGSSGRRDPAAPAQGGMQMCSAEQAARFVRATRLELKRQRRTRARTPRAGRARDEQAVAWRASDQFPPELLLQVRPGTLWHDAPFAQTEYLIRLTPQRFQRALEHLLLDDEHVLAFLSRPPLAHRTGWRFRHAVRDGEGLLLLTDRQVLWLCDVAPSTRDLVENGYVARSIPFTRLSDVALVDAANQSRQFLASQANLPLVSLGLESQTAQGCEPVLIPFPKTPETEQALTHLVALLHAFLPVPNGQPDQRLLRLPQEQEVEPWLPQGEEAARLQGLGGIVPRPVVQRLEHRLHVSLAVRSEEVLVATAVPALEEYRTPARLVALTPRALLLFDDPGEQGARSRWFGRRSPEAWDTQVGREPTASYPLATISSAALRYSLLGSRLDLCVPQATGSVEWVQVPFHSPALTWFLPLFTRLRLLLTLPARASREETEEA